MADGRAGEGVTICGGSKPPPYNVKTDVREKAFSSGRRGTALAVDEVFSCSISENKPPLEEAVMIHNVTPHPSA